MTMPMTEIKTALDATGLPFAHFAWQKNAVEARTDHGVYAEDDELALYANNGQVERILQGTIDYYTRDDTGGPKATIETQLDAAGIMYRIESIEFEQDTGFIHYEWIFEVLE